MPKNTVKKMSPSKKLYYKDDSGTWHLCSLKSCPSTCKGYPLPPHNIDVKTLLIRHRIFLARIDDVELWYIPDIEPNMQKLDEFIEIQKEAFESDVKRHWYSDLYESATVVSSR